MFIMAVKSMSMSAARQFPKQTPVLLKKTTAIYNSLLIMMYFSGQANNFTSKLAVAF
jgi:hypothetical protein